MQCPTCGSDNVQKLSILYETGTNDIQTSSTTVGAGIGRTGAFGSAQTTTTGKSQSKLAKKAAPPDKKSYMAILAVLAGIALFLLASQLSFLFIAVLLIAGGSFLLYKSYTYNNTIWQGLYENWQKLWHCNKCGTIYAT